MPSSCGESCKLRAGENVKDVFRLALKVEGIRVRVFFLLFNENL
jgi:hypothetical protein